MFLSQLNDSQKNLFLELAIKAAEANGQVEEEEKDMINIFAKEMDIEPIFTTSKSIREITGELIAASLSEAQLRAITFEIAAIVFADSNYDESEKQFMNELVEYLGVPYEKLETIEDLLMQYGEIYTKICKCILVD